MTGDIVLYKQIGKDFIKRKYIDLVKKGDRLKTAMQVQIDTLKFYDYLPRRIVAVELFGMHGLWITKDYAPQCAYLEFYEINHVYAMFAKKFIRNATVVEGDSIRAVLEKRLKRDKYNFIVSDNPLASPYGHNYFEHFDLFPQVIDYVDDAGGVVQLNFIHNPIWLSDKHMERRERFYGKANPTIEEASNIYEQIVANSARVLEDVLFVPRNDRVAFVTLVIRGGCLSK